MTEQSNKVRRCPTCRRGERIRLRLPEYSTPYHHEGQIHTIVVKDLDVWKCTDSACGAIGLDDDALTRLDAACRDQLGLLQPEMIRAQREKLGLSQMEMAMALHMADGVLANLEEGQIAPRDTDTLLRLFFKLPEVRRDLGVVDGAREIETLTAAEVGNLRLLDV